MVWTLYLKSCPEGLLDTFLVKLKDDLRFLVRKFF